MVCPNCEKDIKNFNVCPSCGYKLENDDIRRRETVKKEKKTRRNLIIILSVSIIILISLVIINTNFNKEKKVNTKETTTTKNVVSKNTGLYTTYYSPTNVDNIAVGTMYDEVNKRYSDIDIYGIRFIFGEEATNLAISNNYKDLIEGFNYIGFEYKIKLNNLDYLGEAEVKPIFDVEILDEVGNDFFELNDHHYKSEAKKINEIDPLKNGEEATGVVIYQAPNDYKHSVCIGKYTKSLACFSYMDNLFTNNDNYDILNS